MTIGIEGLPAVDATLREIIGFSASHDPTLDFRARWGGEYAARSMNLWSGLLQSFKSGEPSAAENPDELLMCLSYDIAAGPYSLVPVNQTLSFHQWLLHGLRKALM